MLVKNFLCLIKFWVQKDLGSKQIFRTQKEFGPEKLKLKKNVEAKKKVVFQKKILGRKNCGSEKVLS